MRKPKADDAGIDKLQELLLGMAVGDAVSTRRAAEITGLDPLQCESVLDELVRAGIMIRLQHDAYVRCRLDDRDADPESGA